MKTLIIRQKDDIVNPICQKYFINCISPFNAIYYRSTLLRKFINKVKFLQTFFFNKKIYSLDFDIVIVFDFCPTYLKWLKRKYPSKRVIYWYWNPITKKTHPRYLKFLNCEIWSYNKHECIEYGLKYNSTFWSKKLIQNTYEKNIDILFIGKDKGRKKIIRDFLDSISQYDFKKYIYIIDSRMQKRLDYSNVISLSSNSKVILDIYSNDRYGYSLRVMEALFLGVKLITNNANIVEEFFYSKDNIFVLGYNDIEKINNFIESPCTQVPTEVLDYFDFGSWLARFSS